MGINDLRNQQKMLSFLTFFVFLFCPAMLVSDHLAREESFSNRYCLLKRIRNQKILLSSNSLWVLYLLFLDCLVAYLCL